MRSQRGPPPPAAAKPHGGAAAVPAHSLPGLLGTAYNRDVTHEIVSLTASVLHPNTKMCLNERSAPYADAREHCCLDMACKTMTSFMTAAAYRRCGYGSCRLPGEILVPDACEIRTSRLEPPENCHVKCCQQQRLLTASRNTAPYLLRRTFCSVRQQSMHDLEGIIIGRARTRNESALQTLRFTVAVAEQEVCCVHNHPHTMLVAQNEKLRMVRAARRRIRIPL